MMVTTLIREDMVRKDHGKQFVFLSEFLLYLRRYRQANANVTGLLTKFALTLKNTIQVLDVSSNSPTH